MFSIKGIILCKAWTSVAATVIVVFAVYSACTVVIFRHRVSEIATHYTMPDVDTDGGLWYQWYLSYIKKNDLVYDVTNLEGFPLGYDVSIAPIKNLIYSFHVFLLTTTVGYNWKNLIVVNNVSSLLVYPIAAFGVFTLVYYLTKRRLGSFFAGLVYGFSFYAVFMGRGIMSINHIEFIPFYLLSLIHYLNNKKVSSLILSVFVYGLMFRADAYYAFWSGLFSVAFVFLYKPSPFGKTVKNALGYYIPLFLVLFLMNSEFLVSQLPIMFNKQSLIQTGRNSNPKDELTSLLFYLSLPIYSINRLKDYLGPLSFFMNLPLWGSIVLLYFKRNRLYLLVFSCFLASVILSSYVPGFYQINLFYFRYFGMFRGVGRLAIFASLFLAILFGIGINELTKTTFYSRIPKIKNVGLLLLALVIILSNLNNDATWYRLTDMSKIQRLYEPLLHNNNITAIASYPMTLGAGDVGFPQSYELVGQLVHNKPLVAGLSQFSTIEQREFQNQIRDISNPITINALAKYGINTILIRNKLLNDSLVINSMLKSDPRVMFIGDYSVPFDEKKGKTNSDRSRDISLYQIKNVQTGVQNIPTLFVPKSTEKTTYKKINASKYIITINNVNGGDILVLNLPNSNKWELFEGDLSKTLDIAFLFKSPVLLDKHFSYQGLLNGWYLDGYKGKSNVKFTVFFKSQALIDFDQIVAYSTVIILIVLYILSKIKEEYEKSN
jgi:hypothetical protein